MTITAISHVGIVVPDFEAAIALYSRRLEMPPGPILENPEQNVRLVQFDLGNARIELLSPLTNSGPIAEFLRRNPHGGLHHLSLSTGNLQGTLDDLEADGAPAIAPASRNVLGKSFAFIHPRHMCGVLLELEGPPCEL